MHEVGLMQEVIEVLRRSVQENGVEKVSRVRLVVGQMTAALPQALSFAFEVLAAEEPWLAGAQLEIEERELKAKCLSCGGEYAAPDYRFVCPHCSSRESEIVSGRELYVDFYEGS